MMGGYERWAAGSTAGRVRAASREDCKLKIEKCKLKIEKSRKKLFSPLTIFNLQFSIFNLKYRMAAAC
jgi:hypothetical protein